MGAQSGSAKRDETNGSRVNTDDVRHLKANSLEKGDCLSITKTVDGYILVVIYQYFLGNHELLLKV